MFVSTGRDATLDGATPAPAAAAANDAGVVLVGGEIGPGAAEWEDGGSLTLGLKGGSET